MTSLGTAWAIRCWFRWQDVWHTTFVTWMGVLVVRSLFLPDTTTARAQSVAERCRLAISHLNFITEYQQEFSVSASFGISSSVSADEPHLIISQAGQAFIATVKADGRNQVKIFTDLAID